jgi:type III secretion system FlhB-like substrate exporter
MYRPSWQDALEGAPEEKKAIAYALGPDGRRRVVAAGTGAAAEEIIARAQESGVEVRRNAGQVEELLRAEGEEHSIPPEVYEIMAAVINFAQELNEQFLQRRFEADEPVEAEAAEQDEACARALPEDDGDGDERF